MNDGYTKKSRIVLVTLSISLLISGCSFQNRESNASVKELNPQISPTDSLEGSDFRLTAVMDSRQVKRSEVLSFSCETITARPTEVTTYCADFGIAITNIRWISWTAKGAVGKGIYRFNDCDPSCASGKVSQSPVGVNLDGLYTDGERYFLRNLTFEGSDNLSSSERIEGIWDLAEFYLETPDMRSGN
jgi:hypothetical protein